MCAAVVDHCDAVKVLVDTETSLEPYGSAKVGNTLVMARIKKQINILRIKASAYSEAGNKEKKATAVQLASELECSLKEFGKSEKTIIVTQFFQGRRQQYY